MINLFQFASDDQSLKYLAQIFGYMNGVIPIPTEGGLTSPSGMPLNILPSGTSITLLGTMFKTFNGVVLAVGTLIVVYTTVVGVMQTAYEGEFMGKKWNNIWIPIRTVLGIAALVPTGSGYSGIQLIMMWVIVQGIGAADTLWTTVLKYVDLIGSPYAQMTIPNVGTYQAMNELFKGLTCDQTMRFTQVNNNYKPSGDDGGYYCLTKSCSDQTNFPSSSTIQNGLYQFTIGPGGMCGVMTYCNQDVDCAGSNSTSLKCAACKAQVTALETVIPTLTNIASKFVLLDYQYRYFYAKSSKIQEASDWQWIYSYCSAKGISRQNCCINMSGDATNCADPYSDNFPGADSGSQSSRDVRNPSNDAVNNIYWPYGITPIYGGGDFIATAVSEYQNQLTEVITNYITDQSKQLSSQNISAVTPGGRTLQDAQKTGWILAGSYYYDIANMNDNNLKDAMPTLTVQSTDPGQDTKYNNYRINYTAASTLMSIASGSTATTYGNLKNIPNASQFGNAMDGTTASINAAFTQNSKSDNPLYQLTITGSVLLTVAEVLFGVIVGLSIALGFAGGLNFMALGTGLTENPLGLPILLLYFVLLPALVAIFGLLISLGGLLGIYVPLIPYILFTFGAIGWLISTVEAMVAGPLVALGILSPSGQHELLGKAEPALMLLFNIFLRPSLMIFGMMAAMLLATVVVKMINAAFYTVMTGIGTGSAVLAWVLFLCAYVTLIVTALNKCFAAIYLIPEKVMRWISGQGEQYGEAEALGEAKRGVEAGMAGAKAAGEKGAAEAKGAGKTKAKHDQAIEAKKGVAPGKEPTDTGQSGD